MYEHLQIHRAIQVRGLSSQKVKFTSNFKKKKKKKKKEDLSQESRGQILIRLFSYAALCQRTTQTHKIRIVTADKVMRLETVTYFLKAQFSFKLPSNVSGT